MDAELALFIVLAMYRFSEAEVSSKGDSKQTAVLGPCCTASLMTGMLGWSVNMIVDTWRLKECPSCLPLAIES